MRDIFMVLMAIPALVAFWFMVGTLIYVGWKDLRGSK
jgi:hypothetical protein